MSCPAPTSAARARAANSGVPAKIRRIGAEAAGELRALAALVRAGHDIALVLTQPDRPAGRGLRLVPSAVKALAQERGLALYQPASLKDEETHARLRTLGADAMVVAAYGLIPVSYTHLRAHETRHDLVCRL